MLAQSRIIRRVRVDLVRWFESALEPRDVAEAVLVEALARELADLQLHASARRSLSGRRHARRAARQIHDLIVTLSSLRGMTSRKRWTGGHGPEVGGARLSRYEAAQTETADSHSEGGSEFSDISELWRERLVLDPEVCATSPTVRNTRVTVRHVVSLVVDGWSWAAILEHHPGLEQADIRACLAYCVEEEGGGFSYD
jgi:uncharacterized protein (DUF433 family)